jgi:predicted Zn-dependent protease
MKIDKKCPENGNRVNSVFRFCLVFLMIFILAACASVPLSGRKQMNLLPESMLLDMGLTNYRDFLNKSPAVQNTSESNMVKSVGSKIASAVQTYLNQTGNGDRIKGYQWEFNLVNDKTINAWCMPGGKVVVYSGLLPVTANEAGLAYVMGHEIAHAVARHGNERLSQVLLTQMGGLALNVALAEKSTETQAAFMTAHGVGTTVGVLLPFSRTHESEADKLGMIFMALAGYNPSETIATLQRMQAASGGGSGIPEFLSTHPSDATRMKDAKAYLPKAMTYYKS